MANEQQSSNQSITKKELHCIARHMEAFMYSCSNDIIADFADACNPCLYQDDCVKYGLLDNWVLINKLYNLEGCPNKLRGSSFKSYNRDKTEHLNKVDI